MSAIALSTFKETVGLKTLQFMKGRGRQYCALPNGKTLFMAAKLDKSKPLFVFTAPTGAKSGKGEDISGSLWVCNQNATLGDLL
jgi:hypothetical protein